MFKSGKNIIFESGKYMRVIKINLEMLQIINSSSHMSWAAEVYCHHHLGTLKASWLPSRCDITLSHHANRWWSQNAGALGISFISKNKAYLSHFVANSVVKPRSSLILAKVLSVMMQVLLSQHFDRSEPKLSTSPRIVSAPKVELE